MNKLLLSLGMIVFILLTILTALAGWISNVVQVCHMASADQITAYFIVKCVGILVAPVGSVLGIVGWF
jgi:hypothetical protein